VLGFLARFLASNGEGNVLSTPNLLTLDNEEAKIVVGQNVPFVTGQFTNTGGNTNTRSTRSRPSSARTSA
jgi:general secretion pathway protein D